MKALPETTIIVCWNSELRLSLWPPHHHQSLSCILKPNRLKPLKWPKLVTFLKDPIKLGLQSLHGNRMYFPNKNCIFSSGLWKFKYGVNYIKLLIAVISVVNFHENYFSWKFSIKFSKRWQKKMANVENFQLLNLIFTKILIRLFSMSLNSQWRSLTHSLNNSFH